MLAGSVDRLWAESLMTIESHVTDDPTTPAILTVSELNRQVAQSLENEFGLVWLTGEVSTFTRASSGHLYLTLKDASASVRAVMFRGRLAYCEFQPAVGDQVQIKARIGLYEPRGDFQLNIQTLRRAGRGTLYEQFLLLKERLQAEGLFDLANKRPLPEQPKAIGVITSLGAAALHDVLTTLARRAPHVPIIVYPSLVQGSSAPRELRQALAAANRRQEVDTLLLVRGGGSLEDLWAFNDEGLARDIASSALPIIAGVGHESDVSMADFVADLRAPTPTAAAELACLPRQALLDQIRGLSLTSQQIVMRKLEHLGQRLDRLGYGLVSPAQRLDQRRQALALLSKRLEHAIPDIERLDDQLKRRSQSLTRLMTDALTIRRNRLALKGSQLETLAPAATLARGFAIVRGPGGVILTDAAQVQGSDLLTIDLAKGRLKATVQSK
jgi:exodeoxyribonuclease VII large subunit